MYGFYILNKILYVITIVNICFIFKDLMHISPFLNVYYIDEPQKINYGLEFLRINI